MIDKEDGEYESNKEIIQNEIEILADLPSSPCLIGFYEVSLINERK